VAVRAQEAQVFYAVVVADTIYVVQLQTDRAIAPQRQATLGARIGQQTLGDETLFELSAMDVGTSLDKDFS
jgi:hypothetical protein